MIKLAVQYTIEFDEKQQERLLKMAKEGVTIRRLMMHEGLDGAFTNDLQLDYHLVDFK